jgi:hypothetical protein
MRWVCQSVRPPVCLSVTPLLQHLENHMSKGNKGNRPERILESKILAKSREASCSRHYFIDQINAKPLQNPLNRKWKLGDENPCLEKQCVIHYARWSPNWTSVELNCQYFKIVMPYKTKCYKRTKNTCNRTSRKASNISMIRTLNFEMLKKVKH